ncbi:testis-expressed protein 54 [Thomomys bottae]
MGCCQDKDFQTSDERFKDGVSEEEKGDAEETGLDTRGHTSRRSNESLLITVLWRRISMFSSRSTRSTKRHSEQVQKQEEIIPEGKHEASEEPEKG